MSEPSFREIAASIENGTAAVAERLCRLRLVDQPDDADTLQLLALSLLQQERFKEAIGFYLQLTERFPQSALHWGNYSTALRLDGQLQEADSAASTAIHLAPEDAAQYLNLGLTQLQRNDFPGAYTTLLKAHSLDQTSPAIRIYAARACIAGQEYVRSHALLRPWRSWLPLEDSALQLELARTLLAMIDAKSALVVLKDMLQRVPGHLPAKLLLAAVYERNNQLSDLGYLLNAIAAEHPQMDQAAQLETVHILATLATRHGNWEQAKQMLASSGPRNKGDADHYFMLAQVYDKLGQTESAMQALIPAHALQLEELKLTAPAISAPDAPIFPSAAARVNPQDYQKWPQLIAPSMKDSPIFIVGFPRSGTTLLEQMLDAHPQLQSMDERPFLSILDSELADHGVRVPVDLHRLNQRDCDELRKRYLTLVSEKIPRNWRTQLVDKNPLNMLALPLIMRLFPQAKFILALRHPCDVVLSNYMQNYHSSGLSSACSSLTRTAQAYVTAMQCWLHHVQVFTPNVLISRYEELVADLPRQTQSIAAFLELDDATPMQHFDRHARDKGFIATPSYTQVVQPVNLKAINRWLRYRREFAPVLPILEPMLRHWDYASTIPAE